MKLYQKIKDRKEKISIVGLGYVGMPLAVAFAKAADVVGFDISTGKVEQYNRGIDVTKEVGNEAIKSCTATFTDDASLLKTCKFHVVAVPTPINTDKTPNLKPVIGASKTVGANLTRGSIVVFESTVYPGVTEDICVPILEKESGLVCGTDFKVGYSPERINPGDKVHRLENIVKVVSGMDDESLEDIANVYEMVIEAGVHRAESIQVAEAAKVIENSQRDINIAFMNELSIIFNQMNIDTQAVLKAAGTKWNFLNFTPGLVGGHCIGVDPYYLTYCAESLGYHSQIILSGRKINDSMGKHVAENTIKQLIKADKHIKGSNIAVFGVTFKENCPDVRNTKVIDIINELKEYGINVSIVDPVADQEELQREYGLSVTSMEAIENMDALIFAVKHEAFSNINEEQLKTFFKDGKKPLIDIKGLFNKAQMQSLGYLYWRL